MSDQPEQECLIVPSLPEQTLMERGFIGSGSGIKIGRKSLATKLGSTESRLHTLEWRRQQVPTEWLPVLRTLEFRIPKSAVPEPPVAAVDRSESSVLVIESVATEATVVEPPVVAEPPIVAEAPVIAQAAVEAPPLDAVPPDSQSALPSGNLSAEPSPPNPCEPLQLYHGRWLRERRYKGPCRFNC